MVATPRRRISGWFSEMQGCRRVPMLHRPRASTVALIGMGVLAAWLVFARTVAWGVGLSADSAAYISAARNLLAGHGFLKFDGSPFSEWPPLYPLLLAALGAGTDPAVVATPLNAAAHGLTVFVVGSHLRSRLGSWIGLAAAGALALCIPLAALAARALSDSLFLLWVVLALTAASGFRSHGGIRAFVCMALFSALAGLTRYVGVAVPIAIAFALLGRQGLPGWGVLRKVVHVAGYGLIAVTPMALWVLYKPSSTGDTAGERAAPDDLLIANGFDALGFVGGWIVGTDVFSHTGRVALAVVFLFALAVAGVVLARRGPAPGAPRAGWLLPWVAFALIYPAAVLGGAVLGFTWPESLDGLLDHVRRWTVANPGGFAWASTERLWLPLFVALIVVTAWVFHRGCAAPLRETTRGATRQARRRSSVVACTAVGVWMVWQVGLNARDLAGAHAYGAAETRAAAWARSETRRRVVELASDGVVHSNEAGMLYLLAGGDAVYQPLPVAKGVARAADGSAEGDGPARVRGVVERAVAGDLVVWFDDAPSARRHDFGLPTLRLTPGLTPVAELADGAVFRVDKAYRGGGERFLAAFAATVRKQPVASAAFDVYWQDGALTYAREPCATGEVAATFFLHVVPRDVADLPHWRTLYGFDNLDFHFHQTGAIFGGKCLATVRLPRYPIVRIHTGQYERGGRRLWRVEFANPVEP